MNVFVKTNILILLLLVQINFAQEEEIKSNLTIFKSMVDSSLEQYLVDASSNSSLIMNIKADQDFKWIFEEKINTFARQHNIDQLYRFPALEDSNKNKLIVEISLQKYNVSYKSGSVISKKNLIRTIALDYYITLSKKDNRILTSEQYSNTYQDTIETNQINRIQDSNYPFTMGKKNRRFSKFLEPLMVISVTGTISYIFYAFRSK